MKKWIDRKGYYLLYLVESDESATLYNRKLYDGIEERTQYEFSFSDLGAVYSHISLEAETLEEAKAEVEARLKRKYEKDIEMMQRSIADYRQKLDLLRQ